MRPLITVGMPVYDAMPYLPEAMESLLAQHYDNFEILAIVDGSMDGSLDYLRSIRDARLRILTQENAGVTATLNRLLAECGTPWLVRQDADDVSHPQRMGRIAEAIEAEPDAGMFYSFANYHPRERSVGSFRCSRGTPEELRAIVRDGYLLSICHPTAALNVDKTLALGGYRVGLHNEDADLWWRIALTHAIHCIPYELVGFRQNGGSVSSRNLEEQMTAALYVQYLLLSHLTEREPRPYGAIRETLEKMLRPAAMRAKEGLRSFNMALARKQYLRAGAAFAAAVVASPRHVLERLRDEFVPAGRIANGVAPRMFFEQQEALWR